MVFQFVSIFKNAKNVSSTTHLLTILHNLFFMQGPKNVIQNKILPPLASLHSTDYL